MLTQEQIKNLKPGDPLIIQGTYVRQHTDGDIVINCNVTRGGILGADNKYFHPGGVSLPSEHGTSLPTLKYDPTKPLIEGDIVKRRTVYGRTDLNVPEGVELTVTTEEGEYGNVGVREPNGRSIVTKAVFLELITPVEELEPYSVHEESMHNRWNVIKDKYVHGVHAMFPYKNIGNSDLMSREEAKARADEYSARLNAEWRKEHGND